MTANEDAVNRWRSRWRCHRSLLCCQYVDDPNCNGGSHERHRWVRTWNWFRAMMAGF